MTGNPQSEQLFLHEPTTGLEIPRSVFSNEQGDQEPVNEIERAIHLLDTLDLVAAANRAAGFVTGCYTPEGYAAAKARYGRGVNTVIEGYKAGSKQKMLEAKWSFARANGFFETLESGESPKRELKAKMRTEFEEFVAKYGSGDASVKKRRELKELLQTRVEDIRDGISIEHRSSGIRHHKKDATLKKEKQPVPSPAERLAVIKSDLRAGFYPTTHREKNIVLSWLDYLDNPDFPLGVNDQLNEVFTHAQKVSRVNRPGDGSALRGAASGQRALESIAYELVDYYLAAHTQAKQLGDLQRLVANCPNPRVSLLEEVGAGHPGLAAFVRYVDLKEFTKGAEKQVGSTSFDAPLNPLRTREFRTASGTAPGRHKEIQDEYTATEMDPFFEDRIAQRIADIKIREVRTLINEAVNDQSLREHFMRQRLEDLELARERRAQRIVREIAQQALVQTGARAA